MFYINDKDEIVVNWFTLAEEMISEKYHTDIPTEDKSLNTNMVKTRLYLYPVISLNSKSEGFKTTFLLVNLYILGLLATKNQILANILIADKTKIRIHTYKGTSRKHSIDTTINSVEVTDNMMLETDTIVNLVQSIDQDSFTPETKATIHENNKKARDIIKNHRNTIISTEETYLFQLQNLLIKPTKDIVEEILNHTGEISHGYLLHLFETQKETEFLELFKKTKEKVDENTDPKYWEIVNQDTILANAVIPILKKLEEKQKYSIIKNILENRYMFDIKRIKNNNEEEIRKYLDRKFNLLKNEGYNQSIVLIEKYIEILYGTLYHLTLLQQNIITKKFEYASSLEALNINIPQLIERIQRNPVIDYVLMLDGKLYIQTKNIALSYESHRLVAHNYKTTQELLRKGMQPNIGSHVLKLDLLTYEYRFRACNPLYFNYHIEQGSCLGTFREHLDIAMRRKNPLQIVQLLLQSISTVTPGDAYGDRTLRDHCFYTDAEGTVIYNPPKPEKINMHYIDMLKELGEDKL